MIKGEPGGVTEQKSRRKGTVSGMVDSEIDKLFWKCGFRDNEKILSFSSVLGFRYFR